MDHLKTRPYFSLDWVLQEDDTVRLVAQRHLVEAMNQDLF